MSWKISGQVWDIQLPQNKLLVLLAMADHADHEGNNVYPSIGLIAWKTGYSKRQVQRIIKSLISDGLLEEKKRPGQTTLYRINLAKGVPKSEYKPDKEAGRKRITHDTNVTPDTSVTSDIMMSPHPRHPDVTPGGDIMMSPEQSFERSFNQETHSPPAPPVSPLGNANVEPRDMSECQSAAPAKATPALDVVRRYEARGLTVPFSWYIRIEDAICEDGLDAVIEAVDTALERGKMDWRYVEGILRNRRGERLLLQRRRDAEAALEADMRARVERELETKLALLGVSQ